MWRDIFPQAQTVLNAGRFQNSLFRSHFGLLLLTLGIGLSLSAQAVLFYSTDDPEYNTTEPAGSLAGSGWQHEGFWGGFLGTPIGSNLFITAQHVGGQSGDKFTFQGVDYYAMDYFDDPNTDLRIWRVCGTFSSYAPLYTNNDEINKGLVVLGRGTQRGTPVLSSPGNILKGWQSGPYDGRMRWGENKVSTTVTDPSLGDFLVVAFDANGGTNEAHLSSGDSGGAVFIQDGGTWKLAGINYAVEGPYNTNTVGAGFQAAIFDEGGLYKGGEGKWILVTDRFQNVPGVFYVSRISANLGWINGILSTYGGVPPPPVLQAATDPSGPYVDLQGAVVNEATKTVTVARTVETQFYRLRACGNPRLTSIQVQGDNVVIQYE
jgi:hypothetical protein